MAEPDSYQELCARVATLARAGNVDNAIAVAATLAQAHPLRPEPWLQWAVLLCATGRNSQAEPLLLKCIGLQPGNGPALSLLGEVLVGARRFQEARVVLEKSVQARPTEAHAWLLLGRALSELGETRLAIEAIAQASVLAPDNTAALDLRGRLHAALGEWSQAERLFKRAWELSGSGASAVRLGDALIQSGQAEAAEVAYRSASHALSGGAAAAAASQALFAGQFLKKKPAQRFAEHESWAMRFGRSVMACRASASRRLDDRPLRLAFLSPRFRTASVSFLLLPLVENLLEVGLEICLYAEQHEDQDDSLTARFRERASMWRRTVDLDDEALGAAMQDDRIDIAIDLAGHTPGNRLAALSARCAPLTLSWLDYCDTTGCAAFDAVLSDGFHTPAGGPQRFVERLIRLDPLRFCYAPPPSAPDVRPLTHQSGGRVVFGAFHRLAKINADVARLWAQLLAKVPESTLQIRCDALASAEEQRLYRDKLQSWGLPTSRVLLRGPLAHRDWLVAYGEVDICLDTFPYNGGITTLEALYMGRPVVALCGDTMISRQSAAILTAAGLERLVATTPEGYVELAAALATDGAARVASFRNLRQQLLSSPVCDAFGFSRRFANAMREAWRRHCIGDPVGESP